MEQRITLDAFTIQAPESFRKGGLVAPGTELSSFILDFSFSGSVPKMEPGQVTVPYCVRIAQKGVATLMKSAG